MIEGDPHRMSLWYPLLECLNKGYLGGKAGICLWMSLGSSLICHVRKINLIKRNIVCLDKDNGGLVVRMIRELNLAILEKWC